MTRPEKPQRPIYGFFGDPMGVGACDPVARDYLWILYNYCERLEDMLEEVLKQQKNEKM